jgi:hypothetical protein
MGKTYTRSISEVKIAYFESVFLFEELWHSYSACSFSDGFAVSTEVKSYPQRK